MTTVNLIHPLPVTIELMTRSAPVVEDPVRREPVHGARSAQTVVIQAQIKWYNKNKPRMGEGGPTQEAQGYILVHRGELVHRSITLHRGDKITGYGAGALAVTGLSLFLLGEEPQAHYPDQGGPSTSRFHFTDRSPVR